MRRTYEFAAFRLDPAQRRLERNGETVALHAKAFDTLVYLVEHAGEPVSRRALTEALWPKRVVEENNLTQAISALRRVLGDECIVTLAGRGYQFVAEVRSVEIGPSAAVAAGPEPLRPEGALPAVATLPTEPIGAAAARPARTRRALPVAAGIAVVVIAAGWGYFSLRPAEREAAVVPAGEPAKVLVLPFDPLSEDAEQQAVADGLTDDLIIRLQSLSGLRVMGRTTSYALRGSNRSVPDIAASLGVEYVLEGSVGRDGDRLRTRAQLSDATGFSVWGESFDRPFASILDIDDEIVAGIAAKLRMPSSGPSRVGTDNVSAYAFYRAARAQTSDDGAGLLPATEQALDRLARALELDGEYADAWAQKARVHIFRSALLPREERDRELVLAESAADKAIALAPDVGEGYLARAGLLGVQGDWSGAERDYRRAAELGSPDLSENLLLLSAGRFARVRDTLARWLEVDPLHRGARMFLMLSHEMAGQPAAADAAYEQGRLILEAWPLGDAAWTWIQLGREGAAVPVRQAGSLYAELAQLGREEARARLHQAATDPKLASSTNRANLAIWAAHFDETQLALQLLREAITDQFLLAYIAWLPVFDEARQTSEFKDLLVTVGLPEHWRASGWPEVCRPLGGDDFVCD